MSCIEYAQFDVFLFLQANFSSRKLLQNLHSALKKKPTPKAQLHFSAYSRCFITLETLRIFFFAIMLFYKT